MDKITIPKDIEGATLALDGVAALLTAKKWERAAIVYAFTEGRQGRLSAAAEKFSFAAFAALGISGLTQAEDVADLHKRWQDAIDDGLTVPAEPGRTGVPLPDLAWTSHHRSGTEADRVARAIKNNPAAVVEALTENPQLVAEALAEKGPGNRFNLTLDVARADRPGLTDSTSLPPRERDYSAILRHAVSGLSTVTKAMRDERWEPDGLERVLLHFTSQILNELTGGEQVPDSLFEDIEKHLKEGVRS